MKVTIAKLERRKDLDFVSDEADVVGLFEMMPKKARDKEVRFDSLFVKVKNGEVIEAWGIEGTVPRRDKMAERLV